MSEVSDYWKPMLEKTEKQRDEARGQLVRLRLACRRIAVIERHRMAEGGQTVHVGWLCRCCDSEWECAEQERHFPDCPLFEPISLASGEFDAHTLSQARVFVSEKPSTSYLQRKMGITYNRAAALMERLERDGVVSPPNAAGMRKLVAVG